MIRKFFVLVVFSFSLLKADILDEKIYSIVGEKQYNIHKNLINMLFSDREKFILNDRIRYYRVFKTLQDNGLLDLHLNKPQNVTVEFKVLNKNMKSYKILNDTVESLGYRYFFTKSMDITKDNGFLWKIVFKAEYVMDPVILLKELQQKNCKILNIQKRALNHWYYEIDLENSFIEDAYKIEPNEKVVFQKPLQEYLIKVENIKVLQVIGRKLNRWFPYIVFFDKDLNVLGVIKKNRIYRGYKTQVPENTRYIKISDMYNLINIKRGLSIIVK